MKKYNYDIKQIEKWMNEGASIRECARRIGIKKGNEAILHSWLEKYCIINIEKKVNISLKTKIN